MSKRDEAYVEKTQKKLGCYEENCGTNFIFTVSEHDWKDVEWKRKILKGRCTKCSKYLKLSKAGLYNFGRLIGAPELVVLKSIFNDFFEVTEKKKDVDV